MINETVKSFNNKIDKICECYAVVPKDLMNIVMNINYNLKTKDNINQIISLSILVQELVQDVNKTIKVLTKINNNMNDYKIIKSVIGNFDTIFYMIKELNLKWNSLDNNKELILKLLIGLNYNYAVIMDYIIENYDKLEEIYDKLEEIDEKENIKIGDKEFNIKSDNRSYTSKGIN